MAGNYELNLEHERAEYALKCVNSVKELPFNDNFKGKYASEVKQTATRLQTAGLLQTLAFYCSKMTDKKEKSEKNNHFVYLVTHLLGYVLDTTNVPISADNAWKLYQELLSGAKDSARLMYYTEKAKSVTRWLMRFAATILESSG